MAQGTAVKVLDKPEASALGEMVNAELSNQIATAKKYPRDEDGSLRLLEKLALKSDAVAEQCMYTLKRTAKNKDTGKDELVFITGPSIHFMQLLNYCWGNMRAAARIVEEGEKTVTAQGLAYDLQRNNGMLVEIKRGITTSKGFRFGQDMINVTSNAACSIAERNAIEDCIPRVLWWDIFEAVKTKAVGAAQIPEKLQNAVKFFVSKGAKQEDILAAMAVASIEDMDRTHLEIFIGLRTALKEGSIDAAKIFTAEGVEQRARLSLTDDGDLDPDPNAYNTIDKQLQARPAEPAAGTKVKGQKKDGGAPKDAAAKGDGVESQKPATDPATAGSASTAGDPKTAGGGTQMPGGEAKLSGEPGDAQPQDAAGGAGESSAKESDADLLTRVEQAVAATRTGKRDVIVASRADLERIRDTASEVALTRRAFALLNRYDLDA
jgi:hypothetical protein